MNRLSWHLFIALLVYSSGTSAQPLFDTHLHYNANHAQHYSPPQIIDLLKLNSVQRAVVTSRPPELVFDLFQSDPKRIIPFLGIYRQPEDKEHWHQDMTLPIRVAEQLVSNNWRGIGELHIFATNRHSPVLQDLVNIAANHKLPLLMHADPAVIDTIYEQQPQITVIWAHAGVYPYPDLLADYLQRYSNLYIDLSVRDARIAPGGKLADDWYDLFLEYPDRFLIGVDTYSVQRWDEYREVGDRIRHWLSQLPGDIAKKFAYQNAGGLFGNSVNSSD